MSQNSHKEETIICPNCGFSATKNYCAQCGQETHLHKETFFGMIFHFVAHYFHYDSKFWQTLKMLFLKPGKLTVDYWEKKRARHIPPVSLYIFVSAVFFILFFSTLGSKKNIRELASLRVSDSVALAAEKDSLMYVASVSPDSTERVNAKIKAQEIMNDPDKSSEIFDTLFHAFPKVFFFMIPLMALILKSLYARRKQMYFVDHAVFSLHIHTFTIIVLSLMLFEIPSDGLKWYHHVVSFLQNILFFGLLIYLVLAIRNAYRSGWVRSVIYSLVITVSYLILFLIIVGGYFAFLAGKAIQESIPA